jgi:hypothetical protein
MLSAAKHLATPSSQILRGVYTERSACAQDDIVRSLSLMPSGLHNANRGLLVVPHLPLDVDLLERAVFFETSNRLVELSQQGWSILIALIETSNVHIWVEWFANRLQGRVRYPAWASTRYVIRSQRSV